MSNDHSRNGSGAALVALKTHDILCHVFEVDRRIVSKKKLSSKDLLCCALVSRAFCEPALRVLWTNMSPPTPLWQLLIPTNMEEAFTSVFLDTMLSGKLYKDAFRWARFMWYARFVQELHITDFEMCDKHKQLIHALIAHNGGESIFPSLQALWWSPSSTSDSSYFPLFTSELRSAIFDFPYPTKAGVREPLSDTFLTQLRASSPRLDYLCVDALWECLKADHLGVISSFEHLTNLKLCVGISLTSFHELANMPRMKSLWIHYIRSDEPDPSHIPSRIHAPHLTSISVGGNCPALAQLFTALHAPLLASAGLHAISDHPLTERHADYDLCIQALATACSPAAMEDLCITLDKDGGPEMCMYLNDLTNPLLVFPNLTRFSLSCPMVGLVADDSDLWAIVHGWPKLRSFRLWQAYWDPCIDSDDEDSEGILIPTPNVLESFHDYCPNLRELMLPHLDFDADVPACRCGRGKVGLHGHGLRVLAFGGEDGDSDDEDYWMQERAEPDGSRIAAWAQYVSDLFPRLDAEKNLSECRCHSAADGWREVFKRVRTLRKPQKGSSSGRAVAKLSKH